MIGPDRSRARPGFSGRTRHRLMFATEPARAVFDAGSLLAGQALLRQAPRGEPHPVLVLPGLLASDVSTMGLRRWIRRLGYPVRGWELGRNRGPTQAVVDGLPLLVDQLAQRYGQSVSVVGWSLGGIFARRMALNRPETIRQVITLGSPFGAALDEDLGTPGERMYQRLAHLHVEQPNRESVAALRGPLPVPSTSVYSRWDGIVNWRDCLQTVGPNSENVAVRASHLGLGQHPGVHWIVADRLAQPVPGWQPFRWPVRIPMIARFDQAPGRDG
jgi:pimeloyl-ACP methyl ester carboxylesterase